MDGYAICMNHRQDFQKIEQHAGSQSRLIRLLEDCVPEGSTIVGIVISHGSQIQPKRPLLLVA